MPAQLSKLHVRFIQTQKKFSLHVDDGIKYDRLETRQLYIRDNCSFYFVDMSGEVQNHKTLTMIFKEANEYLSQLQCKITTHIIEKGSDEYDNALLFFQVNEADVKALLLLSIISLNDA